MPGVEASPDKMLQGRLFSYSDTHRHRLGANYLQLPVNCPYRVSARNYQRDGPMTFTDNQGGAPNYYPNSFSGPEDASGVRGIQKPYKICGEVARIDSGIDDNFTQATDFWDNGYFIVFCLNVEGIFNLEKTFRVVFAVFISTEKFKTEIKFKSVDLLKVANIIETFSIN